MARAKDIPTNMQKVMNNGFLNNSCSLSDPYMDMITFEHIDVHALNSAVDKKIRTLERPHSLTFDDMILLTLALQILSFATIPREIRASFCASFREPVENLGNHL
jgi:hypothetical protein